MHIAGRETELAAVGEALDRLRSGPAALVISGEPGIGKTTLWRQAAASARTRGYQILSCRPAELDAGLSFSGLADLLELVPEQLVAGLPAPQREALDYVLLRRNPAQPGACHRPVYAAATTVLRELTAQGPVVVAVDDAQWLDATTATILQFAIRRLAGAPLLILASIGDGDGAAAPFGLDEALDSQRVRWLSLGPLSQDELHVLVSERTGVSLSRPELRTLHEMSGGNPFFAVEVARALPHDGARFVPGEPLPVPQSLADRVLPRLGALSAQVKEVLLCVSALPHATVSQLGAVMGGPVAPLLECAEEDGVVEISDGHVRFTHPLMSSAVYARASAALRRRLHRRLAGAVTDADERAWHMALAGHGPDEELAAALESAARAAEGRGAPGTTARLWDLACRKTPPDGARDAHRRRVAASISVFRSGDTRRARSMLESAVTEMAPGRDRGRALLWLGTFVSCEESSVRAAALLQQALSEAGEDRLLRASLHLRAAILTVHDAPGRLHDAEAAVTLLETAGDPVDPSTVGCALLARSLYRFLAGRGIDTTDLARARHLLRAKRRTWESAWANAISCQWAMWLDQPGAQAGCAAEWQRTAEGGEEPAVPHALAQLAEIECWHGQWQQASAHAAQAAAAFEQTGQRRWRGLACYVQALPHACLGEAGPARAAAEDGLQISLGAGDPWHAALNLGVLGFLALSRGEWAAACGHLSHADDLLTVTGLAEPARHRFHADYIEAAAASGDTERASALLRRLADRREVSPYPWLRMVTARSHAIVRAGQGDIDAAAAAAQQALAEHTSMSMPFEEGRSLLVAGQVSRRRKEKLRAGQYLGRARAIFDDLGAALWSARAAAELQRLGLQPGSRHGLTPTEERVARMAATGKTNRQVAASLFVSEKTIEANLSRVYRKLGINSRKDLADFEV